MKNVIKKSIFAVFIYFLFVVAYGAAPLFDVYPGLVSNLPHISLGDITESPIIKVPQFEKNGVQFYLKNSGAVGVGKDGKKIFSGNKRYKLEFILADALAKNAKCIYTAGAAGSNFTTATAAYAKEYGLKSVIVLGPQRNTSYLRRNLLLSLYYGAELYSSDKGIARVNKAQELLAKDPSGYFIPVGGSNAIGTIGFINAAFELKKQIDAGKVPEPDIIYIASGSYGTTAGLAAGLKAAGLKTQIKSINSSGSGDEEEKFHNAQSTAQLMHDASKYLHERDKTFEIIPADFLNNKQLVEFVVDAAGTKEDVAVDQENNARHKQINIGTYSLAINRAAIAIAELYQITGIKLDGTYTGKAFAVCLDDLNSGRLDGKVVMFWNTFCDDDFSEEVATVDYRNLNETLQKYFLELEGYEISPYDQGLKGSATVISGLIKNRKQE